jgi:ABC-type nickel/cobalt efflux system permease component RcnA
MRIVLALVLLLGIASAAPAWADPFHRGSTPAIETAPGFDAGAMRWLAQSQYRLNEAIADAFHDVENGRSRTALALVLGLSFLYGVLHAVGPGHGKSVVASYFVAHHARWRSGVLMGSLIALIQGAAAIVLVGILALLLGTKQIDVLHRSDVVAFVSYALILAVGVWMFYRAAIGKLHAHDVPDGYDHRHRDHDHHHRLDRKLILVTGLTPCASAIIILLFALANRAFGLGVVAVAVLTAGMAVTTSTVGVATVLGRRALLALIDSAGVQTHRLERGLAMAAAVAIVAVSGLMMYDAWTRF